MEHLIQDILAFTGKRPRSVIRICGHGASGKSTFAKQLHQAYPDGVSQIMETDLYVIPNRYSQDLQLHYELDGEMVYHSITACHPARHECIGLTRDLMMLRKGMNVLTPDADWSPAHILKASCPVTIVEGMSSAFLEADVFDISLFFYTDADTELKRRLNRDTLERGRIPEFITQSHRHRRRQYDLYLAPHMSDCDIIVNQTEDRVQIEKCHFPNET